MSYQSPVPFPFLPEGRTIGYVPEDHEHMAAAREAAQKSKGCRWRVGTVLVKDGRLIGEGANAIDAPQDRTLFCPRQVLGCKSGQGYEHCPACVGVHSEVAAVQDAHARGEDVAGADAFLYGHWWCCEPCWNSMIEAGVANVYLVEGATEQFEKVDWQPPQWSGELKTYISGGLTRSPMEHRALYEQVHHALQLANLNPYLPHLQSDPQDTEGAKLTPAEVYTLDYTNVAESQLLVAYVGEPSLGTGMEIQMANELKIPTILFAEEGVAVSRLALGAPNVEAVIRYTDVPDLLKQLHTALEKVTPQLKE